jgi:hypothetical protein
MPAAAGILFVAVCGILAYHSGKKRIRPGIKIGVVAIALVLGFLLALSVPSENAQVPNPEVIRDAGLRNAAIETDRCLRANLLRQNGCSGTRELGASELARCRQTIENSRGSTVLRNYLGQRESSQNVGPMLTYACSILEEGGVAAAAGVRESIWPSRNAVACATSLLNWLSYMIVFCFLGALGYLTFFAKAARSSGKERDRLGLLLNRLVTCWILLVLWLPFRIYSDWQIWYGDLGHLVYYSGFIVTIIAAILSFVFLSYCFFVIEKLGSPIAAFTGVVGAIMGASALVAIFKEDWVVAAFKGVAIFPTTYSILILTMFLGLLLAFAFSMVGQGIRSREGESDTE